MKDHRVGNIVFNGIHYNVDKFKYFSGRLGLLFTEVDNDKSYFSGTLNIDNVKIIDGEIIVKSHLENEGLLETLVDNGFIKKQTIPITLGFNKVYICKLKSKS